MAFCERRWERRSWKIKDTFGATVRIPWLWLWGKAPDSVLGIFSLFVAVFFLVEGGALNYKTGLLEIKLQLKCGVNICVILLLEFIFSSKFPFLRTFSLIV